VRGRIGDVPDRLQYELLDRLGDGRPTLEKAHDVQPVHIVQATKGGHQTVRPFVRAHARDILLYWALVDALEPVLEPALGDPDRICGNRWTPKDSDLAPSRLPNWSTFEDQVERRAAEHPTGFIVRGDVSSFYMAIDREMLARTLLAIDAHPAVVEDLRFLLAAWETQGVRGLPQGLPPSGPLANLYLRFADEALDRNGTPFVRYSDDFALFCDSFGQARAVLDSLERELYARGVTLGGDKTKILRASTIVDYLRPESERRDRAMREFAADYEWDEEEIGEAERNMSVEAFDEALAALAQDRYERSEFIWAFRRLRRLGDPHALAHLPLVLRRMPGLTAEAMSYVSGLSSEHRTPAMEVLEEIIGAEFHRDQEWLHVLRAMTHWAGPCSSGTVDRLAQVATEHPHPVVRARGLLAWCRQSPADSTEVAEAFFARERRMWQGYPVMAIRDKTSRDDLYARWRGERRTVSQLIDSLLERPIAWHKT
jgi:hypothetical protein